MDGLHSQRLGSQLIEEAPPPVHAAPSRSTPWGILGAVGSFVLAYIVAESAGTPFFLLDSSLQKRDTLLFELIGYQFLALGVVVAVIVLLTLTHARRGLTSVGFRFPGWQTILKAAATVPFLFVAVAVIAAAFDALFPGFHIQGNAQDILQHKNQHIGAFEKIVIVLWLAVEAPLVEETLFRGIMYQGLRQFFLRWLPEHGAIGAGAVLSGVIFGLVHGEPHTLPILALLGVWLALVFQFGGRSIYASGIVHGIVNAVAAITTLSS